MSACYVVPKECGISAQEMNCVLKEEGFLDGNPRDYDMTEKGLPFAEEKEVKRSQPRENQILMKIRACAI